MIFFRKPKVSAPPPQHIAIIMDGNGRWAKKRGIPRTAGHAAGAENFRKIATHCRDIGVKYLTVYAFSTENWKRPADEVDTIWNLLRKYLQESLEKMVRDRVKIRILGERSAMPDDVKELLLRIDEKSLNIDGITLCICLNYGGRNEILQAVSQIIRDGVPPDEVSEQLFEGYLYSAGIPDPDLVIRTSGEVRTSNFLPWQSAYAEWYFVDTLWPDFSTTELDAAIAGYRRRNRRFGNIR